MSLASKKFQSLDTGRPLRSEVVRQIVDQISQGGLRPGEQLPTESELCNQFNVSRTVVREALLILRQFGLLEARQGIGTFVAQSTSEAAWHTVGQLLQISQISVWHAHELREILEPTLAALAAERADEDDRRKLVAALKTMEDNQADKDQFIEADLDFHTAVAAATKNPVYGVILMPILDVLLEIRRLGVTIPGAIGDATAQHQSIVDYISAQDPASAQKAMLEHLQLVGRNMREAEQVEAERERRT